ncbi:MAG: hypothetical protein ACE5JA_06755 [bacterium]
MSNIAILQSLFSSKFLDAVVESNEAKEEEFSLPPGAKLVIRLLHLQRAHTRGKNAGILNLRRMKQLP